MPSRQSFPIEQESVGVISDTHLEEASQALLAAVRRHLAGCERILHAGDITEAPVLEALGGLFRVEAVRGNMDFGSGTSGLPRRRLVQVGGLTVGLIHGSGGPSGQYERLLEAFGDDPPPVIVHGHSHRAGDLVFRGVRFLNPGSATAPRGDAPPTIGRLTVAGGVVIGFEILPLFG
ncbi:MAG: metallophosphoesterase family protein [Polyangia bacterium]|jgi:putative phosphoesterase|nr:metallophosphoesterase family protein [Polyangia bacterium]